MKETEGRYHFHHGPRNPCTFCVEIVLKSNLFPQTSDLFFIFELPNFTSVMHFLFLFFFLFCSLQLPEGRDLQPDPH